MYKEVRNMIKLPIAIRDNKTIMISDLTEDAKRAEFMNRKIEYTCIECNEIITDGDWWYFDGTTKLCKCNKCSDKRNKVT